jgi:hypothetical protein
MRPILVSAIVMVGSLAADVHAAAPRLILVTGPMLKRPVLLESWDENMRLMLAVANPASVAAEALPNRPFHKVALFWGPEWAEYITKGRSVKALRPEQGNQHARFYPAVGSSPPLFVFEDIPGPLGEGARKVGLVRSVEQRGLDVLAKRGIRVRIEEGP